MVHITFSAWDEAVGRGTTGPQFPGDWLIISVILREALVFAPIFVEREMYAWRKKFTEVLKELRRKMLDVSIRKLMDPHWNV